MMRRAKYGWLWFLAVAICLFLFGCTTANAQDSEIIWADGGQPTPTVAVEIPADAVPVPKPAVQEDQQVATQVGQHLSRREKRQLGLLPRQIIANIRAIVKSAPEEEQESLKGYLSSCTAQELAAWYAMEMSASVEYGAAWQNTNFDWEQFRITLEQIFEFVLKLLPLILELF